MRALENFALVIELTYRDRTQYFVCIANNMKKEFLYLDLHVFG